MKYLFLFLLAFFLMTASAQTIDSIANKQVDSLILVSRDLTAKKDFEKALEVIAVAEKLALEKFGHESEAYGSCCFNRGRVNHFKRNFPDAEKWYLEAKSIREKVLGKEHKDYAANLNNLAILYMDLGNYSKAEPLYLETKDIREKILGKEHPDYASTLNNIATLYITTGKFERAEPLLIETLSIRKKVQGNEHPQYAFGVNNLGALYFRMGNYEKAEPLLLEAKNIQEKILGPTHPDYGSTIGNLASLYLRMGNYEKAETYYLENKAIKEKVWGKAHPQYATLLNNLSALYVSLGKNEKAESILIEAKVIRENAFGKTHPEYAQCLVGLADLYSKMGQSENAEINYLEAALTYEKVFGKDHPDYAATLFKTARLYYVIGQDTKAEPLFLEAKAIREKVFGKDNPEYIETLSTLAHFYENQSQYTKSSPLLNEALTLTNRRIMMGVSFLSEEELSKYTLNQDRITVMVNLFLFRRPYGQVDILPALSFEQALFHKGFVLQAATRQHTLADASPESRAINNELKTYRQQISQQLSKPVPERLGLEEMEAKSNALEKELAATVNGYADALRQVKWQEVQETLPKDAIALEFVHFGVNFPQNTDSIVYAALLLRQGIAQPLFIPLFEEMEFDHLLSADKERKADYVNDLYAWADRGMIQLGSAKKSLYDLIWAKIEATGLEGIKTVYYSPSGVLHRLNLGAIALDDETILSDRYNLVALNSTRQLVIPAAVNTLANDALLVGGVNFEVDTTNTTFDEQPLLTSRSAEAWTASGTRGGIWSSLKWTEKEVEHIVTTLATGGFKAAQLTGSEATEEAIKAIGKDGSSPRVLHIATHGFFFPDPEVNIQKQGLGEAEPVFKSSDNPMIRSGLILAGGNYAWQQGRSVSPDKEDGILTAYEISQMNLANTELVVLSACETGLGDIQGNEGVYGLQRAFKIAGAKYLIMSLWQVPDRETMEFMTTFYKNWLEEKLTIPDAFRKTQREMRDRFFNPYSWAAFVLVE